MVRFYRLQNLVLNGLQGIFLVHVHCLLFMSSKLPIQCGLLSEDMIKRHIYFHYSISTSELLTTQSFWILKWGYFLKHGTYWKVKLEMCGVFLHAKIVTNGLVHTGQTTFFGLMYSKVSICAILQSFVWSTLKYSGLFDQM